MKPLIIGLVAFLCLGANALDAKIYKIPEDLLKETAVKQAILRKHISSANARFELAMTYAYTGRIEEGLRHLKKVPKPFAEKMVQVYAVQIKKDPKNWKNHFKIAFGYYFIKEKSKATESFLKVLAIDKNQVWAMGFIALLEGEQNHNDTAIVWCEKALKIEPNATAIHFLLAEAYRRKGRYWNAFGEMMIVGRLKTEESLKYKDDGL